MATLKFSQPEEQLKDIQIPILNYSYYLNEGYKRHQCNLNLSVSEKCYNTAILLQPYRSQAYYNRGLLMINLNRQKQAIQDIHAALSCQFLNQALICSDYDYTSNFGNKKIQLLTQAIYHSKNNYLAQAILSQLLKSGQLNSLQKMKKYRLMWEEDSIGKTNYALKKQSPIYPNNNFRLNGLQFKNKIFSVTQLLKQYECLAFKKSIPLEVSQKIKQKTSIQSDNFVSERVIDLTIKKEKPLTYLSVSPYALMDNQKSAHHPSNQLSSAKNSQLEYLTNRVASFQNIPQLDLRTSEPKKYRHNTKNEKRQEQRELKVLKDVQNLESSMFSIKSFNLNTMNSSNNQINEHRFCHNGCTKCKKNEENAVKFLISGKSLLKNPQQNCKPLKVAVKTVQIYRSELLINPKAYMIINQTDTQGNFNEKDQIVTQIDYRGGYFPKWGNLIFYLHASEIKQNGTQNFLDHNDKQNKLEKPRICKIQLWNKDIKGDTLIGSAKFEPKAGRFKCQLASLCSKQMKKKHSAYVFMHISK